MLPRSLHCAVRAKGARTASVGMTVLACREGGCQDAEIEEKAGPSTTRPDALEERVRGKSVGLLRSLRNNAQGKRDDRFYLNGACAKTQ